MNKTNLGVKELRKRLTAVGVDIKGKKKPEATKWAEDGEDGEGGDKPEETAAPEAAAPEEAKKDPLEVAAEVLASGKKGDALAAAVKEEGQTARTAE